MRESTAQDYNAETREIEFRVDIYFDGLSQEPLSTTRDDFLIDLDLLDEACSDGDLFIGTPSANELSFTLYSERGTFNPTNTTGTYYGKIKVGVPLRVFCRLVVPEGEEPFEWDKLGIFYVADWSTDITGITADITAEDNMYNILNGRQTRLDIQPNCAMLTFIQDFFRQNGLNIIVKGVFSQTLPFAYLNEANDLFIRDISTGALAFIYIDHNENIVVQAIDNVQEVDHELTDNDQIISISAKQSVVSSYRGVSVTAQKPQISEEVEVLSNRTQEIDSYGTVKMTNQGLAKTPLFALSHSEIKSDADCRLVNIDASVFDANYEVHNNTDLATTFAMSLFGYILEFTPVTFADDTDDLLKIDNIYIQTEEYAKHIQDLLRKYVSLSVPVLELEIRGNPKYQVGDKVHIHSENYNVDFTGWLIRQQYKYDGGLHSTIKVLNSAIIGG